MLFQMSVPIKKNLQLEITFKFTGLPCVSTSCTVKERAIRVKSCMAHLKYSCKLKKKNVHIEDLQDYFSLWRQI